MSKSNSLLFSFLLFSYTVHAQVQVEEPAFLELGKTNYTPNQSTMISNQGAYPIEVVLDILPARRELVPDLRLIYDPVLANGILGAGWRLAFPSKVQRVSQTRGIPRFGQDSDPLYLVDGQELVYQESSSDYRTLVENFVIYHKMPYGWTAEKDGQVLTYGVAGENVEIACGPGVGSLDYMFEYQDDNERCQRSVTGWHLTSIADSYNNRISFKYEFHPDSKLRRPAAITYSHNGSASSSDGYHKLAFVYEARPDVRLSFADGHKRRMSQRLAEIQVITVDADDEHLVYSYRFDYETASNDDQSRLIEITKIGAPLSGSVGGNENVNSPGILTGRDPGRGNADTARNLVERDHLLKDPKRVIRRFTYHDAEQDLVNSTIGWGTKQDVKTVTAAGSNKDIMDSEWLGLLQKADEARRDPDEDYPETWADTFTLLADVDSDSRPDMLVFNTRCNTVVIGANLEESLRLFDENDQELIITLPVVECVGDHRVFLNSDGAGIPGSRTQVHITERRGNLVPQDDLLERTSGGISFVFDSDRSDQLNDFFGGMRINGEERLRFQILDLNRDGFADLLKSNDDHDHRSEYILGDVNGWNMNQAVYATWLGETFFEDYHWSDLDGDGFVDLVGQEKYYHNMGSAPFFNLDDGALNTINDPVVAAGKFGSTSTNNRCMTSESPQGALRFLLGWMDQGGTQGDGYRVPTNEEYISPQEWVWRNTTHADFNGDGILDRLIALDWLYKYVQGSHLSNHNTWDDAPPGVDCGGHNQIYYGNGHGGFEATDYGIGGSTAFLGTSSSTSYPPRTTITYSYKINHFSLVDVDRNGRPEVTQYCSTGNTGTVLAPLHNYGYKRRDGKRGYHQDSTDETCPDNFLPENRLPVTYSGLDPVDAVYGTVTDLDADGFPDGFMSFNPNRIDHGTYSSGSGAVNDDPAFAQPFWYRSQRTIPQNRLVTVENAYGGKTNLTWGMSAASRNPRLPVNVDVIARVDGQHGTFTYEFKRGAYGDQRFLGFGRVEIHAPGGLDMVDIYNTTVALQSTHRSREVYTPTKAGEPSKLQYLDVYVHGGNTIEQSNIETRKLISIPVPDLSAPYFNPVRRQCRFEFGTAFDVEEDLDYYQALCDDFIDESGVETCPDLPRAQLEEGKRDGVLSGKACVMKAPLVDFKIVPWESNPLVDRSTWMVLRDDTPLIRETLLNSSAARVPLNDLSILSGRKTAQTAQNRTAMGNSERTTGSQNSALAVTFKPEQLLRPIDQVIKPTVPLASIDPVQPKSDYPSRFPGVDVMLQKGLKPDPRKDLLELHSGVRNLDSYRMYVIEYDYADNTGAVTEIRALRDVARSEDSAVQKFTYRAGSPGGFESPRLKTMTVEDRRNGFLYEYAFSGYGSGSQWKTLKQNDRNGSLLRTRTRTLTEEGLVAKFYDWDRKRPTQTLTYDVCGKVSRQEDAAGNWTETTRSGACKVLSVTNNTGLTETQTHDRLGRVVSRQTTAGEGLVPVSTWVRYDEVEDATWNRPNRVKLFDEGDGVLTAVKQYTDQYARKVKEVSCRISTCISARSCQSGQTLDEQYVCDADDAEAGIYKTTAEWSYYGATGLLASETKRYDTRDAEPPVTSYAYDAFGRVTTEVRPDEEVISYWYGLGQKVVTDGEGIKTKHTFDTLTRSTYIDNALRDQVSFNAFGQKVEAVDADGNTSHYYYGKTGGLSSHVLPEVMVHDTRDTCWAPGISIRPRKSYTYTPTNKVETETDANGNTISYVYNRLDQLIEVSGPDSAMLKSNDYQYDGNAYPNRRVLRGDGMGNVKVEWLDGQNRVWKTLHTDSTQTAYTFDTRGRRATRTLPWGEVESFRFDLFNAPIEVDRETSEGTATSSIVRNARGFKLYTIDADGHQTNYTYDITGRPLTTTLGDPDLMTPLIALENHYDMTGRLIEQVDTGTRTLYTRDAFGRVTLEAIGSDGTEAARILENTWTATNLPETTTNALGEKVHMSYDALGRLLHKEVQTVDASGKTQTKGIRKYSYDAAGNLTLEQDESGLQSCIMYDEYNRPVMILPPGQKGIQKVYERAAANPLDSKRNSLKITTILASGDTTATYIDGEDRKWLEVAADGSMTRNIYQHGRLQRIVRLDSADTVHSIKRMVYYPQSDRKMIDFDWVTPGAVADCVAAPEACPSGATTFTYTPSGRLETITDAQGNITSYTYGAETPDGAQLLSSVTALGLTTTTYGYDATYPLVAQVTLSSVTDPGQASIQLDIQRNDFFQIDQMTRSMGSDEEVLLYRYDADGRLVGARYERDGRPEAQTNYAYDAYSRVTEKAYRIRGRGAGMMVWDYRKNGQLSAVRYPSGNILNYVYHQDTPNLKGIDLQNSTGSTTRVVKFPEYDVAGRATRFEIYAATDTIGVDRRFEDGHETGRRITGLYGPNGGSRTEQYKYDDIGRLAQIVTQDPSGKGGHRYMYDVRDYLTEELYRDAAGNVTSTRYRYNQAGDRIAKLVSMPDGGVDKIGYTYESGHRLQSVGGETVSWDGLARQVTDHRGQGITYGLANQVRRVTGPEGNVLASYLHSADGQRVAALDGQGRPHAFYLAGLTPGNVMHRADVDGTTRDYVYSANGTALAIVENDTSGGNTVVPILENLTGSPYRIGSGSDLVERDYSAFGERDSTDTFEIGFHNMWASGAEDLYMAGVRVYDPDTGRFLSPDPLGMQAAADVNDAADPYRYAHHNPIGLQDPTGYLAAPMLEKMDMYGNPATQIIIDGAIIETTSVSSWMSIAWGVIVECHVGSSCLSGGSKGAENGGASVTEEKEQREESIEEDTPVAETAPVMEFPNETIYGEVPDTSESSEGDIEEQIVGEGEAPEDYDRVAYKEEQARYIQKKKDRFNKEAEELSDSGAIGTAQRGMQLLTDPIGSIVNESFGPGQKEASEAITEHNVQGGDGPKHWDYAGVHGEEWAKHNPLVAGIKYLAELGAEDNYREVGVNAAGRLEAIWRKDDKGKWHQYLRSAKLNERGQLGEHEVKPSQFIGPHPTDPNYKPTPGWK